MTESVWGYLEAYEASPDADSPDADRGGIVAAVWADDRHAAQDLVDAYIETSHAEDDSDARKALIAAGDPYMVACPYALTAMKIFLHRGLQAIPAAAIPFLHQQFRESADLFRKMECVNLLSMFGDTATDCAPLLLKELTSSEQQRERHPLRCAAAHALGKIKATSPEVVETLSRISGANAEPQSLRAYCIEALMDLGPAAKAAIPVLEQVLKNEAEDENLRNFAWAALKSVGATSEEHPCGGTVAQHLRSLYRTELE